MRNEKETAELIKLGKHIAKVRKSRGVTIEKLAYEMELSKGNVSDIEAGKRDPRFSTLKAIAEGLQMKVWQLLKDA